MRTEQITIYKFNELSESAQERAIEDHRKYTEFPWNSEYQDSLSAFLSEFSVSLEWDFDAWDNFYFSFDRADWHEAMRGRKLSEFNRDYMPTGFCADSGLWMTFCDSWKGTGDPVSAAESALDAFFKAWKAYIEYTYSDEGIREHIECNEYEFTEDGEFWG